MTGVQLFILPALQAEGERRLLHLVGGLREWGVGQVIVNNHSSAGASVLQRKINPGHFPNFKLNKYGVWSGDVCGGAGQPRSVRYAAEPAARRVLALVPSSITVKAVNRCELTMQPLARA